MPTLTDAQLENLIKQHTLEFHFHPSEPYYLTTVDAYLKECGAD